MKQLTYMNNEVARVGVATTAHILDWGLICNDNTKAELYLDHQTPFAYQVFL